MRKESLKKYIRKIGDRQIRKYLKYKQNRIENCWGIKATKWSILNKHQNEGLVNSVGKYLTTYLPTGKLNDEYGFSDEYWMKMADGMEVKNI